ncbi:conserved hypothetical protein [Maridesulfovibrio salexigens DSM 2638]|uniref:Uncharacterized protein n=2 Tax=Maridesulfovibrio salexigens TaxID=880 RepID=C6BWA5_MARSD|nr:conserved hypothetical protein [Maridesulfovibrio salexigens DSM 2638]
MVKFIHAGLMSAVMVVMMCGGAFAQGIFVPQGSAVVSSVYVWYNTAYNKDLSYLYLTNITNQSVQVKVSVYNHDGADISNFGTVYTGSSSASPTYVAAGGIFEIPPYSSRMYAVYGTQTAQTVIYGHANVEWSSSDPQLKKALMGVYRQIGQGSNTKHQGYFSHSILLNGGQPF